MTGAGRWGVAAAPTVVIFWPAWEGRGLRGEREEGELGKRRRKKGYWEERGRPEWWGRKGWAMVGSEENGCLEDRGGVGGMAEKRKREA